MCPPQNTASLPDRRLFRTMQEIAFFQDGELQPFERLQCYDLGTDGFSFLADATPAARYLACKLVIQEKIVILLGEIERCATPLGDRRAQALGAMPIRRSVERSVAAQQDFLPRAIPCVALASSQSAETLADHALATYRRNASPAFTIVSAVQAASNGHEKWSRSRPPRRRSGQRRSWLWPQLRLRIRAGHLSRTKPARPACRERRPVARFSPSSVGSSMSYRSLKAVLGETNLERKCLVLFGICLLALITGSFWLYGTLTEKQVERASQRTGRGLVDAILLRRHWEIFETANNEIKEIAKLVGKDLGNQEYTSSLIKPNNEGDDQPRDEFEWEVLEKFLHASPEEKTDTAQIPQFVERRIKGEYNYYQAVRAKKGCLVCHQPLRGTDAAGVVVAELNEGDLLAVVKVVIPDAETRREVTTNRAILLAMAIITVFLAMVASYLIIRYTIVKPLKHLRDVSDEHQPRQHWHCGPTFTPATNLKSWPWPSIACCGT